MSSRRASLSDLLPVWLLSSQTCIRALLIGVCLSIIHTAGILLAVYLLLTRLIDPGKSSGHPIALSDPTNQSPTLDLTSQRSRSP